MEIIPKRKYTLKKGESGHTQEKESQGAWGFHFYGFI